MKISVEFVGAIFKGPYERFQEMDIAEKSTVEDFLKSLEHFHPSHLPYIMVAINGKKVAHTRKIKAGDKLELSVIVGGG